MACIPGENFESSYSGQEVEDILKEAKASEVEVAKITGLVTQQATNTSKIADNFHDIGLFTTKIMDIDADMATEAAKVSTLQVNYGVLDTRVATAENIIASVPTTYAPIAGDSAQVFEVADPVTHTDAINQRSGDLRYIGINGTAVDSNKLGGIPAANYASSATATDSVDGLTRKATAAEAIAGLGSDCFMTPSQVKAFIDAAIAAIP